MSQGQDKLYQLHLSPLYLLFICFVLIIANMLLYDTINGDVSTVALLHSFSSFSAVSLYNASVLFSL